MVRDKGVAREEMTVILRAPNKTANRSSPFLETANVRMLELPLLNHRDRSRTNYVRLLQPRCRDYESIAGDLGGGGNAPRRLRNRAGGGGGFCIGAAAKHGDGNSQKHACKQSGATDVVFADCCIGFHDGFLWVRLVVLLRLLM